jgi:hypothetical protein
VSATSTLFIAATIAGIILAACALRMLAAAFQQRLAVGAFATGICALAVILFCARAYVHFHPSQWYKFRRDFIYAASPHNDIPADIREGRRPVDPPDHF